jgi:hypothetical protein
MSKVRSPCTVCSTTIGICGLIAVSLLSRLRGFVRVFPPARRRLALTLAQGRPRARAKIARSSSKLGAVQLPDHRHGWKRPQRGLVRRCRVVAGASRQRHHGGDRLSRVEVVFEVASERYPLDERAATLMAENLRVKAAYEPSAEGTIGARAVADAIERRLIEDTADPITLGGDEAEAVFYAPEVPNGGGDRLSALRDAVERLHDERIR